MEIEENEIENKESSPLPVNDIADELAGKMPNVSEHVIDSQDEEETGDPGQGIESGIKSPKGETFNPDIHVAPDKINANGSFRKKPGRKNDSKQPNTQKPVSQLGNLHANEEKRETGGMIAGRAAAHTLFQIGVAFGGEEWQPVVNETTGLNEPVMLSTAFGEYFDSKGIDDFPPGIALTIAVMAYALPRFSKPKTKSRIALLGAWIKHKFTRSKQIDAVKTKEETSK